MRAVPASLSLRPGASATLRVVALRKDGFTSEIAVALKDAPPGFKLNPAKIPAGTNEAKLTLTAPFTRTGETGPLKLEGRTRVDGVEMVRPVVPAEDQMQAFFYRHLVPAQQLQVRVANRPAFGRR